MKINSLQRNINVNRKGVNFMKVKVRKRKPAPVGKEQASKTIDIIKDEFNGKFGISKEVSFSEGDKNI
jgi:hypothetical protein